MKDEDNEPAFPFQYEEGPYRLTHTGMSLRDWFAGQALTGLIHSPLPVGYKGDVFFVAAKTAYEFADAMLKARAGEDG